MSSEPLLPPPGSRPEGHEPGARTSSKTARDTTRSRVRRSVALDEAPTEELGRPIFALSSQRAATDKVVYVLAAVFAVFCTATAGASFVQSDPKALDIVQMWDPRVHVALASVAGIHSLMQCLSCVISTRQESFKLQFIPMVISMIPCLNSVAHLSGWSPVLMGVNDRVMWPGRYISWSCTTTLLIFLTWLTGDTPFSTLMKVLVADWLMLLSGAVVSFVHDPYVFGALATLSFLAEGVVLLFLHKSFTGGMKQCSQLARTVPALRKIYCMTVGTWCLFPLVWLIAESGLVDHSTEEGLWCLCDFGAKMFQATALHQGIMSTVEDRTAKVLQEMRDKILHDNMHMKEREKNGELHVANISHELRTPLNGIIGLSDTLISDPEARQDDEELTHCLQVIRDSGSRLNMLVNNLLDNAALTQNKLKLSFEPIKLHECLDEVTSLLTPLISASTKMIVDVPTSLPAVRANFDRLVQVFFNLLGNSVKFCRKGSIKVKAEALGKWMIIDVMDTGMGISQEKLGDIFKPFEKGDVGSMPSRLGSTGLGLSLVKALVEVHEGTVTATSELGSWTMITIRLPLMKPMKNDGEEKDHAEASEAMVRRLSHDESVNRGSEDSKVIAEDAVDPNISYVSCGVADCEVYVAPHPTRTEILSVDDDHMNHLVISNMLTVQNYAIIKAYSGHQALAFLNERHSACGSAGLPRLILMDLMMPDMDGLEATKEVRKLYPKTDIPIMMISAKTLEQTVHQAFNAGCQDFISKPVKRLDLIARIQRELKRSGSLGPSRAELQQAAQSSLEAGPDSASSMPDTLQQPQRGIAQRIAELSKAVSLEDFFHSISMEQYLPKLQENGLTVSALVHLDDGDLEKLGITKMSHRKQIAAAATYASLAASS